jgi:hypothetical protein
LVRKEERRVAQAYGRARIRGSSDLDQNLRHQQNLQAGIAVVVLIAVRNRLAELLPLMPSVDKALAAIKPGDVVEISA